MGSVGSIPDSSRMSGLCVWDGAVKTPVAELFYNRDNRSPRSTTSPSLTATRSYWSRGMSPGMSPRSQESFNYYVHPGKPPPASTRAPETGHVYKSHAQIAHDKRLCQVGGYHHCDRWERIAIGSQGHSEGGSGFGSGFGSQCLGRNGIAHISLAKR